MKEDNISEKLKGFIIKETLVDNIQLNHTTTIEGNLGITGDDALDLLDKFKNKFDVNISNFEFNKYFQEEGSWVLNWFSNLFKKNMTTKENLTLGQLEKAIKKGKLE